MREQSVQAYLAALESFTKPELETYFSEIADKMHGDFNPTVVERLKQHVHDNDYVMLVSGAFTPLLHAVTEKLPIGTIIGTEIPYTGNTLDLKAKISHIQGPLKTEKNQGSFVRPGHRLAEQLRLRRQPFRFAGSRTGRTSCSRPAGTKPAECGERTELGNPLKVVRARICV
nr:HAD family hydrolase [Planococcus glaciei]